MDVRFCNVINGITFLYYHGSCHPFVHLHSDSSTIMCRTVTGFTAIYFFANRIEMGKDFCVNVTCLGSCTFLLSKAT